MRKIEFQGASKEREDYLQQKMEKPEENDNEEFDILISFCFNLKDCRDDLIEWDFASRGCFPGFPRDFLSALRQVSF